MAPATRSTAAAAAFRAYLPYHGERAFARVFTRRSADSTSYVPGATPLVAASSAAMARASPGCSSSQRRTAATSAGDASPARYRPSLSQSGEECPVIALLIYGIDTHRRTNPYASQASRV